MAVRKRKPIKPIWIILAVAALAAGTGGTLAKYRSEQILQAEMIAAGFHISSNYLREESKTYSISDRSEIEIELYNYELENVGLVSQVDITYEVEVEGGTCDPSSGAIAAGTAKEQVLKIQPDGEADTVKVTVTTEPFAYTLEAEFELLNFADTTIDFERIQNNGDHFLVTIHTGQNGGVKTLIWTDGLIPDNTNDRMRNWTGTSGTLQTDPYSTYELIFFNPTGLAKSAVAFQLS